MRREWKKGRTVNGVPESEWHRHSTDLTPEMLTKFTEQHASRLDLGSAVNKLRQA
jgi:hypothetical protein